MAASSHQINITHLAFADVLLLMMMFFSRAENRCPQQDPQWREMVAERPSC